MSILIGGQKRLAKMTVRMSNSYGRTDDMQKLENIGHFKAHQNIVLKGFDPISAHGFTQVPNYLLTNSGLTCNAIVAYAKLLSYAWDKERVFPGQERMAQEIGSSQPTVARAVKELEDNGWLEIERRGQGKTNIYVLKYKTTAKGKRS